MTATVYLFPPAWRLHTCHDAAVWASQRGSRWTSDGRGRIVLRPVVASLGELLRHPVALVTQEQKR